MGRERSIKVDSGVCPHEIRNERGASIAVFDCRGCAGGSDLASEKCWRGVTYSLVEVFEIDSLVLAGYTETEYSGEALMVLSKLQRLARASARMASRIPPSAGKGCITCMARPNAIFTPCAKALGGGFKTGQSAVLAASARLMRANRAPACASCLKASDEDVAFIWREFEAVARGAVREALGIVGES